jgi:hypothetical protein
LALEKSCHSPLFWNDYEVEPLSLPEGEAACGEHPLDPFIPFPRLSREFFVNLKRIIIFFMNASAGAEAKVAAAQ